jgi:hypothetical protein|nr:MAG TPA: hypothetical protein [Caudoviricetes sp.]
MEQKDFDIYEILKGVPAGTKLYSPMCGKVAFSHLASNKEEVEAIWIKDDNSFNKNGRWMEGGEVMLFPSDKMRDWSKFAWKKGDVLVSEDGSVHIIFEKFTDDTYTIFAGKHYYAKSGKVPYYERVCGNAITEVFTLEAEDAAKTYIRTIEERLGGKLNRETLEVEKPKKPVFELGNLYVFNEDDEDGELTIIGNLIGKNESEDTLTFGNQYEIENEKFVTDQAFDLRISVHDELREATEDEAVTFKEAYTQWVEKEKKEMKAKEQPAFKPFDKVLVRDGEKFKWLPAFFVRLRGEGFERRCNVLMLLNGTIENFTDCIPYEGNEHLAFTSDPF